MKVFGLQAPVYRAAALASRLTAKTADIAAVRRDAIARWLGARQRGLTAEQAARAVGISRASLYRWQQQLQPRSRRPLRPRRPQWGRALAQAVADLRARYPMWGQRQIAVLLARNGTHASVSTVGRILRQLMQRRVVLPVPILRRRPGGRRLRLISAQRHARRLPKGHRPTEPGQLVQVDTLFVNIAPDRAIKHFTAYDPVAKWTAGLVASTASASCAARLIDQLIAQAPFPIRGIQVDGGSEFQAAFETTCAQRGLDLFVLPPKRPQLNGAVERAQGSWRYEFYACNELPPQLHSPWRPHPSRIPPHTKPTRYPPVSNDLSQDRLLNRPPNRR